MSATTIELRPTAGKLIVLVDPADEKTSGGLFIPGTAVEAANLATVVAASHDGVYNGQHWIQPAAEVGDRVVIGKYAGITVHYEGTDYVVLKHEEVLAVIDRVPAEVAGADA